MTTIERTSQRSSGGTGIVCQIGMLTFTVDLATVGKVNKSSETSFPFMCPHPSHGNDPVRVEQRYIDPDHADHCTDQDELPGYKSGELARGRQAEDGSWVLATPDEIIAAKVGDLDPGILSFRVHQAWELDAMTLPGKGAYRVRPALTKKRTPHPLSLQVYGALVELLEAAPHLALVGTMRIRDNRATYRLGVWGQQLVLTEVLLPSDLAERDQVIVDVEPSAVRELRTLLESKVEPFDESVHRFDAAAAVAELVERNRRIAAGEIDEQAEPDAPAPLVDDGQVIDLTAMFSEMIAASTKAA